jgi:predicted CoA-substrate-specific enzyme activase
MNEMNSDMSYILGIDIGSTSTKLVLIDNENRVVDYQYLRTKGNPRAALKSGFESYIERFGNTLSIDAVATTGSGRHFIKRLIGADAAYDEITAQAASAAYFVPEVDTVFEIGGQDSKYISIKDGLVKDFQMNKICAAGTGAFIEEQSAKLNIPLDRFGEMALSANTPCNLGERCTVFIESNINACLSEGSAKKDITAGLCYSVVSNYLNRVVGNKPVGKHILLQGGVAYNPALVAAFKNVFGSRLEAAPWFSVSGAVGAALLVKNGIGNRQTTFKGLLCLEGDSPPKQEDLVPVVKEQKEQTHDSKSRDPNKKTIGIPCSLIMHDWFLLYKTFFETLGFNVLLSDDTNEKIIELSQSYTKIETCYPVKLAIGHTVHLVQNHVDYIFFPSVYSLYSFFNSPRKTNRACIYMQKAPQILALSAELREKGIGLITSDLYFDKGIFKIIPALYRLGLQLGNAFCFYAILKSVSVFMAYIKNHLKTVHKAAVKCNDKPDIAIVSRGYCLGDPALNLGLKEMLEERGYRVLYGYHTKANKLNVCKQYPNLYWSFGSFMLAAVKEIATKQGLYAICPTYHGCGPEGLLSHWAEDELKDKPYLSIEIDEHTSKTGVITRLEAFINSINTHQQLNSLIKKSDWQNSPGFYDKITALDKKLPVAIPYFYPYSTLLSAYLRGRNYDTFEMPPSSAESLAKGRSFMRGEEYFSLTSLLGAAALCAEENPNMQLLFPQNKGSEVDGLYSYFIYTKLKNKMTVISPVLDSLSPKAANILFRVLLAGDIALHSDTVNLVDTMKSAFQKKLPDNETLIQWSANCRTDGDFILIIGDPWCIHNFLFQDMIVKKIQSAGFRVRFAPFSEMLLFDWQLRKSSKVLGSFEQLMRDVSCAIGTSSAFCDSIEQLNRSVDALAGEYFGGFGKYRSAKASAREMRRNIIGVISVSSQYENTASVLELLSTEQNIPLLNLRFDGDNNPINQLKTDFFLNEITKAPQALPAIASV